MIETPDYESFPRFRELNVKNLLYYQVEIAFWEAKLKETENIDHEVKKRPRRDYARSAEKMLFYKDANNNDDEDNRNQRHIIHEIRRLLEKYSKLGEGPFIVMRGRALTDALADAALLQHAQITALPEPSYINVEAFRLALRRRTDTQKESVSGSGSSAWGDLQKKPEAVKPMAAEIWPLIRSLFLGGDPDKDDRDLVTVHLPENLDGFTRWVKHKWTPFWDNHLKSRKNVHSVCPSERSTDC